MGIDDVIAGTAAIDAAADGYAEARAYCEDVFRGVFASPKVRRAIERSGTLRQFSISQVPINVLSDRVGLTSIVATNDDKATAEIKRIRTDNRLVLSEHKHHRTAFTCGDAYAYVLPVEPDPEPDGADGEGQMRRPGVRVIWHAPDNIRAIYGDDEIFPHHVIKSWWEGKEGDPSRVRRADVYYHGLVERWITRPGASGEAPKDWLEFFVEGQARWEIAHGFGQPWFHFRNDMPYGRPEHAGAYGPQDAVNKLLVTHLSTIDYQAWKQWVALMESNAVLDENNDDPDWDDDLDADDASSGEGGVSSGLRVGPGTLMNLHGVKSLQALDPPDPAIFTGPTEPYMRLASLQTGTPLYDFDPSREQPSGVSRKRAESPLIAKIDNRCSMLGSTYADMWTYILNVRGFNPPAIEVRWKPAWTIDDTEGWAVIKAKREAGVPLRQCLLEAGYTPEQLDEFEKERDKEQAQAPAMAGTSQQPDTLREGNRRG